MSADFADSSLVVLKVVSICVQLKFDRSLQYSLLLLGTSMLSVR